MATLDEIIGHLGAAKAQRASSDDKIIADHIDAAYDAAVSLRIAMWDEARSAIAKLERWSA